MLKKRELERIKDLLSIRFLNFKNLKTQYIKFNIWISINRANESSVHNIGNI